MREEKERLRYKREKRAKADLSKAERTPISIHKAKKKEVDPVLETESPLNFVNWNMWLQRESEINDLRQHQGRKQWKHQLKMELIKSIREGLPTCWKKSMNNWGPMKLHNELYRICRLCTPVTANHVAFGRNTGS